MNSVARETSVLQYTISTMSTRAHNKVVIVLEVAIVLEVIIMLEVEIV